MNAPILLLHGGWGGAWCWSGIAPALAAGGHPVIAPDLPGGGLNAVDPHSLQEPSAVASFSVNEVLEPAVRALEDLHALAGPVVIVAHSISGMLLHLLGERHPDLTGRLVYLAAVGPAPGRSVAMDTVAPPWSTSLFSALLIADPAVVGAMRIDPRSPDAGYQEHLRRCWFADVDPDLAVTAKRMLTNDNPAVLLSAPAELTASRWGSLPRSWIRTIGDASIPVAGQDTNIAELDAAFPDHPFEVSDLPSGHLPFLSLPHQLGALILQIAGQHGRA